MTEGIAVQQTLHGYEDGHQLLASSKELTRDQQTQLLRLSDLSGPAFRDGYARYLTGYPVAGGWYAFACTWFAPEMKRPGCVWTHTLLIKDTDLARLHSLAALIPHFSRPKDHSFQGYVEPLSIELGAKQKGLPSFSYDPRPVLDALYADERSVIIPSRNSQDWENLCLAIFDQQWPKLRRNFRFCTGMLSQRDAEFDLSVSPPEIAASVARDQMIVVDSRTAPDQAERWLEIAANDLVEPHRLIRTASGALSFRQFIWSFGAELGGRAFFRPLAEVCAALVSRTDENSSTLAQHTLGLVTKFFPYSNEAQHLKEELFGENARYSKFLGTEEDILRLLVENPDTSSVSDVALNVSERAGRLAESDFATAMRVAEIATVSGGDIAESYLEGFLTDKTISGLINSRQGDSIISFILDRNPQIIASAAFWVGRSSDTSILPKLTILLARDTKLLRDTVSAMYEAKAWDALTQLLDQLGRDAFVAFFDKVDSDTGSLFGFPVLLNYVLGKRLSQIGSLIENLGPRSLKLLSPELDARSWYIRYSRVTKWISAEEQAVQFQRSHQNYLSEAFFLTLGLSSATDMRACDLVKNAFPRISSALREAPDYLALWQKLEPYISWHAPRGKLPKDRLVITIVRTFVDYGWAKAAFSPIFQSDDDFETALTELQEFYQGRRFLDSYRTAVDRGQITLPPDRERLLYFLRY